MITESTGIDRLAETGVALSEANQSLTSCRSILSICRPPKYGRSWFLQIVPVNRERPGLPDPLETPERNLGDRLEQRVLRLDRQALAAPDRGEHLDRAQARLADGHRPGTAEDLPNAFSPILAVDEKTLLARGQHPDAEALELAVTNVADGLAGLEHLHARLGERPLGHEFLSTYVQRPRNRGMRKQSSEQDPLEQVSAIPMGPSCGAFAHGTDEAAGSELPFLPGWSPLPPPPAPLH